MNQYPNGPQPPYQQPPTGYPPQGQYPGPQFTQQPGYPPQYPPVQQPQPQQPVKKKKSKVGLGCGIIAAIVVLGAIVGIANSGKSSTTPAPSGGSNSNSTQQSPSKPTSWQTTHTYSGNGSQKTETIAVPSDWKILWSCDATSFMGSQYNVAIEVDNSDGTPADPAAVNTICSSSNTSGQTEEHQSGNVYLNVTSEAKWSILVQEQK